jgi:hypothetical protein
MSDPTKPDPAPALPPQGEAKPPRTLMQKLTQWVIAIAVIVTGGFGLLRGVNTFFLPSCDGSRTTDTLKSIFKGKNVEVSEFSDVKTLTDTYSEKTCHAHVKTPSEEANIDYRIYWDGWSASIMISKVN